MTKKKEKNSDNCRRAARVKLKEENWFEWGESTLCVCVRERKGKPSGKIKHNNNPNTKNPKMKIFQIKLVRSNEKSHLHVSREWLRLLIYSLSRIPKKTLIWTFKNLKLNNIITTRHVGRKQMLLCVWLMRTTGVGRLFWR